MEPNNSVLAGLKLEFDVAEDPQQNCSYRPMDDARRCRGSDDPYSNHAALSAQPSGCGFRMLGLKIKLKTEISDPDLAEAKVPFTALNLHIKKEPVSNSGDEILVQDATEDYDVSDTDCHFKFSNRGLHFDNCEGKTKNKKNKKENNKVAKENQVSEATNSPKETKYFKGDAFKQRKLLSGDKSLAMKPSVEEVAAETQIRFAASCGENRQQQFDEEDTSKEFSDHQEIMNKHLKCHLCGKVFTRSYNLKAHQSIHTGDKTYKCMDCGKAFLQSKGLKSHQRLHSGKKPYQCTDCDKAFSQPQGLKRHQRIHMRDKPYQCTECDKAFIDSCNLKRHQQIHKKDKPYQCTDCGKAFSDSNTFRIHQRIHDKPYQCMDCGKAFSFSYKLKTHQRIHTGDKPYQCTECGRAFNQVQHLKTHQLIHKGGKPYQCMECDKAFRVFYNLKKHQLIHTENKP